VASEDFALPGAEVLKTEVSFSGEWRGFEVVGRVDRIDRTPEGLVFIDCRFFMAPSARSGDLPGNG
jgi:hypothetical protein